MVNLGLVVAQFNASVTERMADAAVDAAAERGAEITHRLQIPGVYDAPLAVDRLARRGDVDAVAVVGAVVTGDTDHDRVISDATARSLQDVSLERDLPVTFGVTGPGQSGAEARERVGKGGDAVDAAVDLVEALA